MYRLCKQIDHILEVKVLSVNNGVFTVALNSVNKRFEQRVSKYGELFHSEQEAKQALETRLKQRISKLEKSIDRAKSLLAGLESC